LKDNVYEFIKENIREVNDRVGEAAIRSGRKFGDIVIVAVSKTFPSDAIRKAVSSGISNLGESRIQDAEPKIKELGDIATWHMIGHLQSNKVKKALELFDTIQSVDSVHLAEEIEKRAAEAGSFIDCLVEVNSSGEEQKYGVAPDKTINLLETIGEHKHIRLRGLMTIGPFVEDERIIRHAFRMTRELFEEGKKIIGEGFQILSMGMSSDYELAIDEGSNMVRIGTAIFGSRKK